MLSNHVREVSAIQFGLLNDDDVLKMSVCEVTNPKLAVGANTVYDERMGSIERGIKCPTCKQSSETCMGHFGHVALNESILNPLFYKDIRDFMCCFCVICHRCLVMKSQVGMRGLNASVLRAQLKTRKIKECSYCESVQPDFRYIQSDNEIVVVYKDSTTGKKTTLPITVAEARTLFHKVMDEDLMMLGYDPVHAHPRGFVMSVFPVIPPCARPSAFADEKFCDDDLTNQIVEIVKINASLAKENANAGSSSESKRAKLISSLKFRISTFYNNSANKAKTNGGSRPVKGLKERLIGKSGQIRGSLSGKRVNQSARTVISPDPTLRMGQIAIPPQMARVLTFPERVNDCNFEQMSAIVGRGDANYIIRDGTRINLKLALNRQQTPLCKSDVIVRDGKRILVNTGREVLREGDSLLRNGEAVEVVTQGRREYKLEKGDVVERHLREGDMVLLNRQPTLWVGSMMAQSIVIREGKTLRFNLSICKNLNADFDGDESNIHAAQSLESSTELKLLSSSHNVIITPQSSRPNVCIVQDSLSAAYLMTLNESRAVSKAEFYDASMLTRLSSQETLAHIQHVRKVLKYMGKPAKAMNGRGVIAMAFPPDLNYKTDKLKIYRGVIVEGYLDKSALGAVNNSLIHVINKEYGPDRVAQFIDEIQFLTNAWMLRTGMSVGLGDCLVKTQTQRKTIEDVIQKCYAEAEGIATTTHHSGIREVRVAASLSKARDMGMRIAKDALDDENNFVRTVKSGSKGDFFNVCQITGLLGQQNVQGQRVKNKLNNGRRSLPHYPFEGLSIEEVYESRGFVASSFIGGLNPREFFFHAVSGREGITDTAMGTSTSGYIQRRIIKLTEDVKIHYDGTVRDATGRVFQASYGGDGMDPVKTVKVDGKQTFCDVQRVVDRINLNV